MAVFGLIGVGLSQSFNIWKWGARWMAIMTLGVFVYGGGLAIRIVLHSNPQSKYAYLASYLLVILSPCAFIAAEYLVLGKLALHLNRADYLWTTPQKATKLFIISEMVVFLVLAVGGAVTAATRNESTQKIGNKITLVGFIMELLSLSIFTVMSLHFLQKILSRDRELWQRGKNEGLKWSQDWKYLALALNVGCLFIIVRCIYRIAEKATGLDGFLATNENVFYLLDAFPVLQAAVFYIPAWPGRYFRLPYSERCDSKEVIPLSSA